MQTWTEFPAYLIVGTSGGTHLAIDNNEIMAKADGTTPANMRIQGEGGDTHIGSAGSDIYLNGQLHIGAAAGGYVLPMSDGTNNQILVTNGSGSMSWADQSSGGGWTLAGNATGADATFGTTDNFDISLVTSNTERMRLDADGDVGIGVVDPLHQLHIQGSTSASNVLDDLTVLTGEPYEVGVFGLFTETENATYDNIGAAFQVSGTGRNHGVMAVTMGAATDNFAISAQALNGTGDNVGIDADAESSIGNNYGAITRAEGNTSGNNYGLWASAGNSTTQNIAIYADAEGNGTPETIGVESRAEGANENYALHGTAYSTSGNNYGLYGNAEGTTTGTNYGIYATASNGATNYAGFFDGDILVNSGNMHVGGDFEANGIDATSTAIGAGDNVAIRGEANGGDENFGVYGEANGTATNGNTGGEFEASGSGTTNVGVNASASGTSTGNWGGRFEASESGTTNIGVESQAEGTGTSNTGGLFLAFGATGNNEGVVGVAQGDGTSNNTAVNAQALGTTTGLNNGVDVIAANSTLENTAVRGAAIGSSSNGNYGARFQASNSETTNVGVESYAVGPGSNNTGIYAFAQDGQIATQGLDASASSTNGDNYGASFNAYGSTAGTNYGIYSTASNGGTNYAGYFDGDVFVSNGNLGVNGELAASSLEVEGQYTLPSSDGIINQVMVTDGLGNVSWANPPSSGWSLDGNATITDATFGTTDANDISIITNNMEIARFDSDGDIGIGINNPEHALHVMGGNSDVGVHAETISSGSNDEATGINAVANGSSANEYYGGQFQANGTSGFNNWGIYSSASGAGVTNNRGIEAIASGASYQNNGVRASASGSSSFGNYAGYFEGQNSGSSNWGVYSSATGSAIINRGMEVEASGASNQNIGVAATADGPESSTNYAIIASATSTIASGTNYGIHATAANGATNYAGYFDGDVDIVNGDLNTTGTIYATSGEFTSELTLYGIFNNFSDRRLKKNIQTLTGSLSNLMELRGTSYFWKDRLNSKEVQFGVIAQELEKFYPELVTEKENGFKAVNYLGLIPVLIEAIKEQQKEISGLKKELASAVAASEKANSKGELESLQARLEKIEMMLGASANAEN